MTSGLSFIWNSLLTFVHSEVDSERKLEAPGEAGTLSPNTPKGRDPSLARSVNVAATEGRRRDPGTT